MGTSIAAVVRSCKPGLQFTAEVAAIYCSLYKPPPAGAIPFVSQHSQRVFH